ncbi:MULTISPECIES: hypothetical protein [unclassified Lysobacter]|uniref:hypothetical protein n=1 Tax=unclassified Lysobacter TaxID=2635362 RepID=UPI001BEA59EA|nr:MULTISPECIES: hypothetical protein [unclassified Lysobacter]MBT2747850.1 hypothetical protein [Lysobacter sp. ISL-42]MBT2753810.1 hypothetical protein [Lysobacter sp. ISL-50]MBT2779098.1 hypothetical protein [Lysobacter sp. ISL-54]
MKKNDRDRIVVSLIHQVENIQNDNVDAVVRLPCGEGRTVTFFTLENIASIIEGHKATGECLSGTFFWAKDMVIVRDLKLETIEAVALEMVQTGAYITAFGRVSEEQDD